jgi:hypothetical protein
MSWNLGYPEIKGESVDKAKELIGTNSAPSPIIDYVRMGIDGLAAKYGDDVKVTVTGYGHLCDNPGSSDPTNATIEIRRAE